MQGGILNEPVREGADKLLKSFSDQMGVKFSNLLFVAVSADGEFRTANYAGHEGIELTKEAIKMIAKHLEKWAQEFED